MFPYIKRLALAGLALTTMFWVGCSKGGSKDDTPATTQLYQAYKSCKQRTGGQSVMYSMCYSQQDALTNCDCVQDMQAQSLVSYKGSSMGSQNMYGQYGMNGDETIINSYISYLNQVPADAKRRMIEAWNKIGTQSAYNPYGQQYNPYGQQQYNPYQYQQQQYGNYYCDPYTQMCWY